MKFFVLIAAITPYALSQISIVNGMQNFGDMSMDMSLADNQQQLSPSSMMPSSSSNEPSSSTTSRTTSTTSTTNNQPSTSSTPSSSTFSSHQSSNHSQTYNDKNKYSQGCDEGKVTSSQSNNKICIQPYNYIQGCVEYYDQYSCSKCEEGYKLNTKNNDSNKNSIKINGVCDALEFQQRSMIKINGCLTRDNKNNSLCVNCANGYVRNNGKCQLGVKNCIKYQNKRAQDSGQNICIQCKTDYSIVFNQCRYNTILGCKKLTTNSITSSKSSSNFNVQHTKKQKNKLSNHSPSHSCQQCYPPFTMNQTNSHCQIQNCQSLNDYGCVTCQCGYYLTSKRTCNKSEPGCLRYERGRCITCLNHYKLKGGVCQIQGCLKYEGNSCAECKQDKYDRLKDGSCQFRNCIDWYHDFCYVCKKGYKMENGVCEKEDEIVCID